MSLTDDERDQWLLQMQEALLAGDDPAVELPDSASPDDQLELAALQDFLQRLNRARPAATESAPHVPDELPEQIDRFKIVKQLGAGGQGFVFLAYDDELLRYVALKVPKPEALASPELYRRFLREAHAAAGLDHPAIVRVHEIGNIFPGCYLVTEYCPQGSLQRYLLQHPNEITPRAAARFIAELAGAVQYAHERGILHRDIKPSNILLTPSQASPSTATHQADAFPFQPKLSDFGLARLSENDGDRTATGTVLGTPAYMSPEQAGGRLAEIGPATDVYGLGTVLYELLVGRPAFRGVSEADTLRQLLLVEASPPRLANPSVSRDLDAVCLRALEKDPRRRYSSAAALADDLNRYLQGLPTLARPLSPAGKLARAARRHPSVATLTALLLAAVLVAAALFVRSAIEQRRLNAELLSQRTAAERHAREATDLAYAADMQLADLAWQKSDITSMESILARHDARPGKYDPRSLEWHLHRARLQAGSQLLAGDNGPGGCVKFNSDGSLLAAGSFDGRIRLWEMPAARLKWTIDSPASGEINAIKFSPDGQTLAAASNSARVLLCDVASGRCDRTLFGGHTEWVADVAFSPDGERLCSVSGDGTIAIWDLKTGQPLQQFRGHTRELRSVHYTPDGQHIITGAQEGAVQVWNLANESAEVSLEEPQRSASSRSVWPRDIAIAADPPRMAICWGAGGVKTYDLADASHPLELETIAQEIGNQVAFLPNGQLAVGSNHSTLNIWSLGTMPTVRERRGHRDKIVSLDTSPNGLDIATASKDGTVRLWPTRDDPFYEELAVLPGRAVKAALSPDGDELLFDLASQPGVALLQLATGKVVTQFPGIDAPHCGAFVEGGRVLALAEGMEIAFYDRDERSVAWTFTCQSTPPAQGHLGELWNTGKLLLAKDAHEIWAIDLKRRALAWHFDLGEHVWDVVASKDETIIYVGDQIGRIHAFRASDGFELSALQGPDSPAKTLCVSTDGRYLLSAFENREIRLWDLKQGTVVRHLDAQEKHLDAARFTHNGRTLVASHGASLACWHIGSGQRMLTLGPWGDYQLSWALSPDETTLYLGVSEEKRTSVRAFTLQDRASAAQTSPTRPD